MGLHLTHYKIAKVAIPKKTVKRSIAYVSFFLIGFDTGVAVLGIEIRAIAVLAENGGKIGAALGGLLAFMEKWG